MPPKSGILTQEEKDTYTRINESLSLQRKTFEDYVSKLSSQDLQYIQETCDSLELCIDLKTGNISYKPSFQPLDLIYDICYVRHGKTEGNTEPRVFQVLFNIIFFHVILINFFFLTFLKYYMYYRVK
jgi:hypothetical protein